MEGIPTVARGIEDEIRRSAFNGCRRVLNQTSPEELRTLLAAVRQLEATSQVSRRRPRDVAPPPPPPAPDVVSASPPSTDDILFLDQCAELTATPVKFRSEPPPHLPPQQSTTDTGGAGSVVVTASEVTEDARDAIGAYLRTWLDTVIGLSLEALTSWAMHAFCILLGLLPASSAATPKKSKTVLYSILSTFHFSNLEKRQAGPSKTLLEYAAQDRKALEAIGKKSAATTAATKGGAAAAASAPSNNKESRTKVSKNKTPSSTSTPAGKPVKVKTTKKAGMTAEPQPQDDENFDPLLSESEEESDSDHDEDHHLTVAGNVSVLRKTNRTAQGASKVTSSSSSSSRSLVDEAALTQRIAALAYLEAPITLEKLYAKLDVPLSKSEVLRVVEGMAAAQRLFLEHGIVYSA